MKKIKWWVMQVSFFKTKTLNFLELSFTQFLMKLGIIQTVWQSSMERSGAEFGKIPARRGSNVSKKVKTALEMDT